jgi:hypothetical protein
MKLRESFITARGSAVSSRKIFAPVDVVQDARIVALNQNQLTLVRSNDIARVGVAVERGELRTEAPAEAGRVSDHSFTNPRFSR